MSIRKPSDLTEPCDPDAMEERDFAGLESTQGVSEPEATSDLHEPKLVQASLYLDTKALTLLMARIVKQDEIALTTLYDYLHSRVYALALLITGQIGTAEEVLQDTFWQVWRQAPRFDPARGTPIAWVMTMARSKALDARRSNMRNVLLGLRTEVEEGVEFEDQVASDPVDLLDSVQTDTALHTILATLEPIRRQLIALVFYRGLSHDEVATHTGLPLGTVKSHLRRAMIVLRQTLGSEFNANHFRGLNE